MVEADREWCRRMVRRDKPQLLVVSPPCTLFSQLQNLSPYGLPERRRPHEWRKACEMVIFAVELCRMQQQAGRAFVFEHPRSATSWEVVPELRDLLNSLDVFESVLDMCVYGMMPNDDRGQLGLVRKTTRLITNSEEIVDATQHRRTGGHVHVHLMSGRVKKAAEYPIKLCQAISKGFIFRRRRLELDKDGGMICDFARPDVRDPEEAQIIDESGRYIDDLKGS